MIKTVVIRETGELVLPREILEESHITAETALVVMAHAGQILLLDLENVHWVRVIVDPSDPQVFTFKPEIVQKNLVKHSSQ